MIDVRIYIPRTDNNGVHHDVLTYGEFASMLNSAFGGYSNLGGNVHGSWVGDGGRTYQDVSDVYLVCVPGIVAARLDKVAARAKALFKQEAVMVSYLGVSEIL